MWQDTIGYARILYHDGHVQGTPAPTEAASGTSNFCHVILNDFIDLINAHQHCQDGQCDRKWVW